MRRLWIIVLLSLMSVVVPAQQKQTPQQGVTIEDLFAAAEDWANENLDDEVLEIFNEIDRDRLRGFLVDLENRLQTNNVYELAPLRQQARELVPFLEQWEETLPLAEWLKTRIDYLDVSEELKRAAIATNKTVTVVPVVPLKPPTLPVQRTAWKKQFDRRPIPTRADIYVPKLKKIFIEERVPPELVWVAEVESSFDPEARSPVGATGLFQLMKPTAKSYGLSTVFPDERTDPEKNARAAAKYLRHLYNRFGNWPLALAAYNAGETRVNNLLSKTANRDYASIAGKLPAETQLYVPKCEAALQKREGVAFANLRMPL
jgi:membrane-bound lytic murein transglycosylase D